MAGTRTAYHVVCGAGTRATYHVVCGAGARTAYHMLFPVRLTDSLLIYFIRSLILYLTTDWKYYKSVYYVLPVQLYRDPVTLIEI